MYQAVHTFAQLLWPVLTLEDVVEPERFLFVQVQDYRNTFSL